MQCRPLAASLVILIGSSASDVTRATNAHVDAALAFFTTKESCGIRMRSDVEARLAIVPSGHRSLVYSRFAQKEFLEYRLFDSRTARFTGIYVDVSLYDKRDGQSCVSAFYVASKDNAK